MKVLMSTYYMSYLIQGLVTGKHKAERETFEPPIVAQYSGTA